VCNADGPGATRSAAEAASTLAISAHMVTTKLAQN